MRRARAASARLAGRAVAINIAIRSHRRRVVWFHTKGELTLPGPLSELNGGGMSRVL